MGTACILNAKMSVSKGHSGSATSEVIRVWRKQPSSYETSMREHKIARN